MNVNITISFYNLFSSQAHHSHFPKEKCFEDLPEGTDKECCWWLGGENPLLLSADLVDLVAEVNGYAWACGMNGQWKGRIYNTNGQYFLFIGTLNGSDIQLLRYIS